MRSDESNSLCDHEQSVVRKFELHIGMNIPATVFFISLFQVLFKFVLTS